MQWAEINGKQRLLVGGKVNRFIPNPTFDPVAKPGALDEYFRGRNPKAEGITRALRRARADERDPEYRDRDARLKLMDEQGIGGAIFFPTLGVGMEEALLDDPPALLAAFRAFNRWLDDDWGFAYQDRIFAAPMLTLIDPDEAVEDRRVGARPRRPLLRAGARPGHHRVGSRVARRPGVRPDVGPAQRGRRRSSPRTAATPTTGATSPTGARAPRSRRSARTRSARSSRASAVQDTVRRPPRPRAVRPLPEPAHGVDRDRLRLGVPPVREAEEVVLADAVGATPRTRSRPSGGTCGCRRTTRTTSPVCASSSAPTTCCSAPTSPTPRASPIPAPTSRTSRTSASRPRTRSW